MKTELRNFTTIACRLVPYAKWALDKQFTFLSDSTCRPILMHLQQFLLLPQCFYLFSIITLSLREFFDILTRCFRSHLLQICIMERVISLITKTSRLVILEHGSYDLDVEVEIGQNYLFQLWLFLFQFRFLRISCSK